MKVVLHLSLVSLTPATITLLSLVSLTPATILFKAIPKLEENGMTAVTVTIGEEALLECTVKELGNNTILWRKIDPASEVDTLTAGLVRTTSDNRISVIHEKGGDTWLLSIKPVGPSDKGRYVCEVNTIPPLKLFMLLNVVEMKPPTSLNYSECCQLRGVPQICSLFCDMRFPIYSSFHDEVGCSGHLKTLGSCLTDGKDHTPCCVRQQVPEFCHPLCRGELESLTVIQDYNCSKHEPSIFACIAAGLEYLPSPPEHIVALALSPTKLKVAWLPPLSFYQPRREIKITHYQINVTQLQGNVDDNGNLFLVNSEDENDRESKELSLFDEKNQSNTVKTYKVDGNSTFFVLENLRPLTMYEISAMSYNEHGSSVPSYSVRVITPSSRDMYRIVANQSNVTLPDVPSCCRDKGVKLGRCLRILCDPTKADETRMTDIMICAPWANVTFECMADGFDHSPCCRERGVPEVCMEFCSGTIKRVDYRHFTCVDYMPHYGSCLLDHYGVISGPPVNFSAPTIANHWALLRWDPPEILGDTVLRYNLHWRNLSDTEDLAFTLMFDVHSPYLLDRLTPGKRYESFVLAENSYGISAGSSRVVFATVPLQAGQANTTGDIQSRCCFNAGLPESCMPLCSFQMRRSDIGLLETKCSEHVFTLMRCGAGGRDHRPCCARRFISPHCIPICAGTLGSIVANFFSCKQEVANIMQCMAEGMEILPDMPINFEANTITPTSIHLQWDPPADNRSETFRVFYEKLQNTKTLHPANYSHDMNVSSTNAVIENLKPGTRYSMYVLSANKHGYSLPSSVLVVNTSISGRNDTKIKATLSPPYQVRASSFEEGSIFVTWRPPVHVPSDAFLSYIVYYQLANSTTDLAHDGNRVASVASYVLIANLSLNAEYAVMIKARTGQSESDFSEIVLTWTEPLTPAFVQPPVIVPMGLHMEGSNVTILCIASGMPQPNVSVYVNGQLMKEEKERHVSYTIVRIQRNITSVACYANNGYGYDSVQWQTIRVAFKPTVSTGSKLVKGYEGQSVRLQCLVSGFPEPDVTWYKDDEKHETGDGRDRIKKVDRLPEAPTSYLATLTLIPVRKSDVGKYYCKADNHLGSATVAFELKVEEHEKQPNITGCCIKENVSERCLKACSFDVDIFHVLDSPLCLKDMNKIMFCTADGSDHQNCCRQQGVSRLCSRWCRGHPVFHTSTCLLLHAPVIIFCFRQGRSVLPGVAQDINAALGSDGAVYLQWEPPKKNPEAVQWYKIFWRPVGTKELHRNQTTETHFKIQNMKPGQTYEIFIKAGNYYGQSQLSKPAVVSITPVEEIDSNVAVKVAVGVIVTVILLVLVGILLVYFKLRYRPREPKGISFENPTYMKESFNLQNASGERADTGSVIDNTQKNSEPQRAVANIYEEPKQCDGQQG